MEVCTSASWGNDLMPNADTGFTGTEIVTYCKNWFGNASADFQTLAEQTLPLAEFRFCKAHDWKFLNKQNLSLTVTSGTDTYSLNISTLTAGYMQADDVKSIWSPSKGNYLKQTTLETLRRMDAKQDDGTATSELSHWAPVGDNSIVVYPKTFSDTVLKVDGKITPAALLSMSSYPSIPFRYQDSFMAYVIALLAARENDDRAMALKQEAMMLIRQDIQDDLAKRASSADEPRIKHMNEAALDGAGNLEQAWIASLFA
jgi:hypothetical protein